MTPYIVNPNVSHSVGIHLCYCDWARVFIAWWLSSFSWYLLSSSKMSGTWWSRKVNQSMERKSLSVLNFRVKQGGLRLDLKAVECQSFAVVISCACIIHLHQSSIAK